MITTAVKMEQGDNSTHGGCHRAICESGALSKNQTRASLAKRAAASVTRCILYSPKEVLGWQAGTYTLQKLYCQAISYSYNFS